MVRFLRGYRGKATNEKHFQEGQETDVDYLDLTYLLENGIVEEVDDGPDLENLTVDELRDIAKERELSGYYDLRKAELIEALR